MKEISAVPVRPPCYADKSSDRTHFPPPFFDNSPPFLSPRVACTRSRAQALLVRSMVDSAQGGENPPKGVRPGPHSYGAVYALRLAGMVDHLRSQ